MSIPGLPGDENPNPQWKLPREESRWQSQWEPSEPLEATPADEEQPRWMAARAAQQQRVSGRAVGALIVAILGLSFCPFIGSIIAVSMAVGAKREIDDSGGALSGRGAAVAAIALGWIGILIYGLLGALIGIGIAVS